MRHDVNHLSSLVDKKLTELRDKNAGKLENLNDAFVFAFGPFMSMEPGFEHDCDEIAKFSDVMKIFQFAAYLIRRITAGISYGDAKTEIKNFILEVDEVFPGGTHKNAHDSLIEFAIAYKNSLREEQGKNIESFITNSAPIVPYQGTLKKQPLEPSYEHRIDCATAVQKIIVDTQQTKGGNHDVLLSILLHNLSGVMQWKDLTTLIEDPVTGANNLLELDHLIIDRGDIPYSVRAYYFLATINYYGLPIEIFDKYLKFFATAGDFTKPQSYDAFEAMVNAMAETVNPNIAVESWEDPEMERRANELYENAVPEGMIMTPDNRAAHNFNSFLSFIAQHRNMQFGEWPRRAFIAELHAHKVINVNNLANNVTIYELDNGVTVCPFVDIIDYHVKLLTQGVQDHRLDICDLTTADKSYLEL